MSAGAFQLSKYESDNTLIYICRIQPETLLGTNNPPPAGAISGTGFAYMSTGNRRRYGIHARYVSFEWKDDDPPTGYANDLIRIPILTPATFAGIQAGDEFAYLGKTLVAVGVNAEKRR